MKAYKTINLDLSTHAALVTQAAASGRTIVGQVRWLMSQQPDDTTLADERKEKNEKEKAK